MKCPGCKADWEHSRDLPIKFTVDGMVLNCPLCGWLAGVCYIFEKGGMYFVEHCQECGKRFVGKEYFSNCPSCRLPVKKKIS